MQTLDNNAPPATFSVAPPSSAPPPPLTNRNLHVAILKSTSLDSNTPLMLNTQESINTDSNAEEYDDQDLLILSDENNEN